MNMRDTLSRLGLTQTGAARLLGVNSRTVRGWCEPPEARGYRPVPESIWRLLDLIAHVPLVRERLLLPATEPGEVDAAVAVELPLRERIAARLADHDVDNDGGEDWIRFRDYARGRGHMGDCPFCTPALTAPVTCDTCVLEDALKQADAWIGEARLQDDT